MLTFAEALTAAPVSRESCRLSPHFFKKAALLLTSSLTVMAGAAVAPALPEIQEAFAGQPHAALLTKLILTIPGFAIAICAPFAGAVADRFGKRRLLLGSLLLFAAAGSSGMYLRTLPAILVGRVILGIAVAAQMTCATALISDYFDGKERKALLGAQGAFMALGGMFFLTGSGALAEIAWYWPFSVYLAALAVWPLALMVLNEPEAPSSFSASGDAHETPVQTRPGVIVFLCVIAFFAMTSFYLIPTQAPFQIHSVLGFDNKSTGFAIAVATLFSGTLGFFYRPVLKQLGYRGIFAMMFFGMAIGFYVFSLVEVYPMILVAMAICGAGMAYLFPNLNSWLAESAAPEVRGRAVGALTASLFLGQGVSPIIVNPLVEASDIVHTFQIFAVMLALAGGIFFVLTLNSVPRKQRLASTSQA